MLCDSHSSQHQLLAPQERADLDLSPTTSLNQRHQREQNRKNTRHVKRKKNIQHLQKYDEKHNRSKVNGHLTFSWLYFLLSILFSTVYSAWSGQVWLKASGKHNACICAEILQTFAPERFTRSLQNTRTFLRSPYRCVQTARDPVVFEEWSRSLFFAKRSPWIRKVVRVFAPLWLLKNPRNNPNKPPHLSGWHLSVGLWLWMVDSINLVGLGRWSSGPPTHPSYQIMPVAPGTLERGVITPYSLEIEL